MATEQKNLCKTVLYRKVIQI